MIRKLWQTNKATICFVTHDIEEAREMADSSANINQNAENLAQMAEQLTHLVGRFKV